MPWWKRLDLVQDTVTWPNFKWLLQIRDSIWQYLDFIPVLPTSMLLVSRTALCQTHCLWTLGCQYSCTVRAWCAAQPSAWGVPPRQHCCASQLVSHICKRKPWSQRRTWATTVLEAGAVLCGTSASSCNSMDPSQITLPRMVSAVLNLNMPLTIYAPRQGK